MLKRLIALVLALGLVLSCVPAQAALRLRNGSRGDEVRELQDALKELGYYTGKIDGIFGKATRKAVILFQRETGLEPDGLAGPDTLAKLFPKEVFGQQVRAGADDRLGDTAEYGIGTAVRISRDPNWKPSEDPLPPVPGVLPESVVAFLESVVSRSGAVNGTILITKNGAPLVTWSFGGADETTCYRIASITKWVTAIGLMTLYDSGKLDLDRDISDYLRFKVRNPAWPDQAITARMLLSHTSSLSPNAQDYHPDWGRIGKNGYDPIFNEAVKPGSLYAYADYNGALFGCLIEAISGESVQNYLSKKVFQPLGLTAAYSPKFLPKGTPARDLLNPKGKVEISVARDRSRSYNNKPDVKGNNGYTVGKLYIDAVSLTKLARMMLGGGELDGVRILQEDTVRLMEADQRGLAESKYGLGTVRHSQYDRGTWYGHQGRYSGLSSNIYYQRETGLTLAVILNGYEHQLEDNIVLPTVSLLKNMDKKEAQGLGE